MEIVAGQFRSQYRAEPAHDQGTTQALRMFSTSVKLELSATGCQLVRKGLLLSGKPLQVSISRSHFEQGAKLWLEACTDVCERVLKEARLAWTNIDAIVLTGGSSQLPCVESAVRTASGFGNERIVRQHPRASIAYGAALLAAQKFGDKPTIAPPVRQSVSTNDLGIRIFDPETEQGVFHALVTKNSPLPADRSQTIYADTTNLAEVTIHILQRKDEYSTPEALEKYRFGPVKVRSRNLALELSLGYDSAGRVFVRVSDPMSGVSLNELIDRDSESYLSDLMQLLSGIPIL